MSKNFDEVIKREKYNAKLGISTTPSNRKNGTEDDSANQKRFARQNSMNSMPRTYSKNLIMSKISLGASMQTNSQIGDSQVET
jgi:hypothetical protein